LACVVDEFGTFTGIVTMEDLAEEVVGEIEDEHDDGEPDHVILETPEGWVMPAELHIDEVDEALDIELPQGEKETIGGLVIERFGGLPEVGECVEIDLPVDPDDLVALQTPPRRWVSARILAVENYVPSRLLLTVHQGDQESAEADQARSR